MSQPDDADLERLRTLDKSDVYTSGRRAATLIRTPDGVEFRYLDEWIAAGGPPVATTLPTSADDELSLLLAVGADAIGDVQVAAACSNTSTSCRPGCSPRRCPPRCRPGRRRTRADPAAVSGWTI